MATRGYWQRFQRGRVSRRRLMGAAGMGAAGLAVAVACGGGDETPDATATPGEELGDPVRGGRYKGSTTVDWGTLDPLISVGGAVGIFARLYNSLLDRCRTDPDFWFFDLAEELEQPDEETYNFAIRPGVKIGPNDLGIPERDMDAFDAEAWLDRVNEDEEAITRQMSNQWIASYEASDAGNFQLVTKGPYAYLVFRIGAPLGNMMPPREFFEQGIDLRDKGVGAGPFVLTFYEETGGLNMDRNPNYYRTDPDRGDAQLPYLDGWDTARITDQLARRSAFIDGQIYSYGAETSDEKDEILRLVPGSYVISDPVFAYIQFSMNPTRPPWDDEKIRLAALHALDRQEFVDRIVGSESGQPNGLVHWPCGPYALDPEELEELQAYDPDRSRELIREATGQDTIKIKVMYPTGMDVQYHDKHLPIFLQQMERAGFDVEEDALDFGGWLVRYTDVDYDASLSLNQTFENAEVPLDWHTAGGPAGEGQFGIGIGSIYPDIEEAILNSKKTTDSEEHVKRVLEAQRMIYEHGPSFLPIMSWYSYTCYQGFVKNLPRGLGGTGTYLNNWWLEL